jgi:inhibitor of cysteine peptidase
MQKEIKKKVRNYAVVAVLLAVILGVLCYNLGFIPEIPLTQASFLKTFSSAAELKSFLTSNSNRSQYVPYFGSLGIAKTWIPGIPSGVNGFIYYAVPAPGTPINQGAVPALSPVSTEYSTTNTQVPGVDEPDTVKNDGEYIYTVSGNTVFIVKASLSDAGVVSRIECDDFAPAGIFVSGDRLAILGSNYSMPLLTPYSQSQVVQVQTYVRLYDVSDRANPNLLRNFTMTGNYLDSRMIGKYVYFVTSMPSYLLNDTVILPIIYSSEGVKDIPATEIHYSNVSDDYLSYTTFVAMNIQDASEKPTTMSIMMGQASNMYVSLNNIYVTFPHTAEETTIYRVHMQNNNLTAMAQEEVPGQVLNQFSMDEYGDYFRIATTAWTKEAQNINITTPLSTPIIINAQSTNVYVLNMNLSIVGRLENISVGENFHSARFTGDRCYLVTFQKTDPLFVINLADPTSPAILGNLTVSGYSDYLQPYDENHLIGVGKETVEAESGYFSWYQGIKISIFDVSNVSNPVQVSNVTIGDRGSDSPVLYDHKALLFDKKMDLLVIPVTVAELDPSQYPKGVPDNAYGTQVWQGVYVYNITLTNGLLLKGNITHAETAGIPPSTLIVNRALYIGNILYTVSQGKIELNSLADLSLLKEISLS